MILKKKVSNFKHPKKKIGIIKRHDFLEEVCDLVAIFVEARKAKKITQVKLAELLGIKQSAIARFETGNSNPTLVFLLKISEVLELMIRVDKL